MAERELHHLADLIDRVAEAADVVVGDVGAARLLRLLELGPELDLCLGRYLHDTAGLGRDHDEADFLKP